MNKFLIPSSVSKVRGRKSQKNSYGMMPGPEGTCPNATLGQGGCLETKRDGGRPTCYVYKAFRNKRVKDILEHNTDAMKSSTLPEMRDILGREFARFEAEEAVTAKPWYNYRLHWSGDLFSVNYTKALAQAAAKHPKTTFWIYTRSFSYVKHLLTAPNMRVYLSVDRINKDAALKALDTLVASGVPAARRVKLSYMSHENDMSPESRTQSVAACPVDDGHMEIEGACAKCCKCIAGASDIWFKIK